MSNNISIRNIDPQQITISGAGQPTGITNVYVNGVDVTVGTKAYILVPTNNNELLNGAGYITAAEETDPTVPAYVKAISLADINSWNDKQDGLVSGVNIKTINNTSLLGSGDIQITATNYVAGTGIDITDNTISNTITSYQDLTDTPTIPTRTSELINDSGFITNQVDDLENYIPISDLENILPHTSDSGTGDLYLEDSVKYKIKMELKPSEIEQHTTTGKNLFDNTTSMFSNNYVDITIDDNVITMTTNYETISNSLYFRTKIPDELLENGEDYTISSTNVSGMEQSLKIQLRNHDATSAGYGAGNTVTYDSDYSLFIVGNIYSTVESTVIPSGTTAIVKDVQVEKGSSATSYERFTGGMPSPNPIYPQDIHVTSGENSITISNKNLYDGVEYNNYINSLGNLSTNNTNYLGISEMIKCIPSTQYTVTYQHDNPTANLYVAYKDINGNLISRTSYLTSRTFTTPNNAVLMFPYLNKSGVTFDTVEGYVQIERGSTATSYVPYQSQEYPIDLNEDYLKLDGVSDRLYRNIPSDPDYNSSYENGKWCLRQNVYQVYLPDNDEFTDLEDNGDKYSFYNNNAADVPRRDICENPYGKSIYFNNVADGNNNIIESTGLNSIRIDIDKKVGISTIEQLTQWINDNQVIVYFPLKPEYTYSRGPVNETLNTELNDLTENKTAYDGGTNISQENDDLPFDIEADTFKKIS